MHPGLIGASLVQPMTDSPPPPAAPAANPLSQPIIPVLLPLPLAGPYHYRPPKDETCEPGDWVEVPLANRTVRGIVWHENAPPPDLNPAKIKTIHRKIAFPRLGEDMRLFIDWVAHYTLFPQGAVLHMVMRKGEFLDPPKTQIGYRASETMPQGLNPKPMAVWQAARTSNQILSASALARKAGVSPSVIKSATKAGALKAQEISRDPIFERPNPARKGPYLSAEQRQAAEQLIQKINQDGFSCTLLDGVTGAGKTEVYCEAIAKALTQDPHAQILLMLPEIALTLPFLKRLEQRFGAAPAAWHSDMSSGQRRGVWRAVAAGDVRLVVGVRSSLFLPFKNLRLIIVDEEHDNAYKQQDGVLYHARDMAIARAAALKPPTAMKKMVNKTSGFPIILASATPSLETAVNVQEERFGRVLLENRFGGAAMPDFQLIDMRAHPPEKGHWLSPLLVEAIEETLAKGEQTLLFLNRRGYAPLTLCRRCGTRMTAPDSDTWLVEHRYQNKLVCHHSGFTMPIPEACPECGAKDSLTACGPGVERIGEEVATRWPNRTSEVFSSDITSNPAAAQTLLKRMTSGEIDILIATQMAAKGHHFPNLTLVGIVDADLGLAGGDLRAAERSWQILSQVAGRAGREQKRGRALLQSYQPQHPVIQGLVRGDRDSFMEAEAEGRRQLNFPPYGRLAALILSGANERLVNDSARALRNCVPQSNGVEVWGPAPAPLYRLRGHYRVRFLIKAKRTIALQAYIKNWLTQIKIPASVRQSVDIDPYNFL